MREGLREYIGSQEFAEQQESEKLHQAYDNSRLLQMLDKQNERGEDPTALFTDIDNTFIRTGHEAASEKLNSLAEKHEYPIIAVTGNDFQGVMARINRGELPHFAAIGGSVGTELWILHRDEQGKPEYKKDQFYEELLKKSGFERPQLVQDSHSMIQEAEASNPDWKLNFQIPEKEAQLLEQPDPDYQTFKISFHFFGTPQQVEEVVQMASERFPNQAIVTCEEIGHNQKLPPDAEVKKYCLDLLPITKAGLVDYASKVTGIKKGIVAGDSGNDVGMLTETGKMNSVLVGGYKPEAKAGVDKVSTRKSGNRSFQTIETDEGKKAVYVERSGAIAAESIIRAATILKRAENINKIRETK